MNYELLWALPTVYSLSSWGESFKLAAGQNTAMIFPLPLVPFEEYMLLDDRPAHPMNFFCRLRFCGRFDRPALESALHTALGRHPLLAARVRKAGRNRLQWISANDAPPRIQWLTEPPANGFPCTTGIDLWAEPGLRLWVWQEEQAANILIQFHHSCCDGLGAFHFIEDWLLAYALATGSTSSPAEFRPLSEEQLRRRGSFGLTPGKFLRMIHKQAVGLLGAWQFLMHRPVPLTPHDAQTVNLPLPDTYPVAHTRQFHGTETAALRKVARQAGTTVNDLLARDLFLALGDWRSRHCPGGQRDWLRLSVPISLRTVADRRLPAANVVSMVFLDRRPREFADPHRLLDGIHRQMQQIKRLQLGLTFVLSLRVARALPGGIARRIKADHCTATCVFTNLGTVLGRLPLPRREGRVVVGNVVLEGMDCLAPMRPYTSAAFTVFKYAGRMCVTLHYDPRPLAHPKAEDLLETFMRRVRESI